MVVGGTRQCVLLQIVRLAYTIVAFHSRVNDDMEDICEGMISIIEGSGGVVSQRMARHHLGQKIHNDEFWSEALDIQWDDLAAVREER